MDKDGTEMSQATEAFNLRMLDSITGCEKTSHGSQRSVTVPPDQVEQMDPAVVVRHVDGVARAHGQSPGVGAARLARGEGQPVQTAALAAQQGQRGALVHHQHRLCVARHSHGLACPTQT